MNIIYGRQRKDLTVYTTKRHIINCQFSVYIKFLIIAGTGGAWVVLITVEVQFLQTKTRQSVFWIHYLVLLQTHIFLWYITILGI